MPRKQVNGYRYRNVAITGQIGTGKTTLMKLLSNKLGWPRWSGGAFFRDYCKKHNLPLEDTGLRSDELSKKIDYSMRERFQREDNFVVEAWLAGFVSQGVDGVLKVLLVCKDDLRVDRYVNRENVTMEEAIQMLKKREGENAKKWRRVYRKEWQDWVVKLRPEFKGREINFWDPELYDLRIDTYKHSKEEVLAIVLDRLGYYAKEL